MKKKIVAMLAILAVFGLAIAAYAYTTTSVSLFADGKMSCCKKDSCPMKKRDVADTATASSCDCCDCCKDGKCSGDSCPMKEDGEAKATTVSASEGRKSCCDNCDCCKGKHDQTA